MPDGKREDYAQQSGAAFKRHTGLLCSSQEEAISRMRDSMFFTRRGDDMKVWNIRESNPHGALLDVVTSSDDKTAKDVCAAWAASAQAKYIAHMHAVAVAAPHYE